MSNARKSVIVLKIIEIINFLLQYTIFQFVFRPFILVLLHTSKIWSFPNARSWIPWINSIFSLAKILSTLSFETSTKRRFMNPPLNLLNFFSASSKFVDFRYIKSSRSTRQGVSTFMTFEQGFGCRFSFPLLENFA